MLLLCGAIFLLALNELVQQVAMSMGEQSQAVDVVSQSFDEMQQMVNQVNQVTNEQTRSADNAARSMETVNQVAQQSQNSIQEMNQSTDNLAGQAEELKELASSFGSNGEPSKDGKTVQQDSGLAPN